MRKVILQISKYIFIIHLDSGHLKVFFSEFLKTKMFLFIVPQILNLNILGINGYFLW